MSRAFDPGGCYSAMDSSQWLTLKAALDGDESRRREALDVLGALVVDDWLDPSPVPDMVNRGLAERADMRVAREAHQDRRVHERCEFGIHVLQRQRDEERPYEPQRLDAAGRVLLGIAAELLNLARDRDVDREAEAGL
ncbi:hypothetical protein [Prauserella sp. PE36]|uniref:hypothetical protein n=1 Tax=Prauserella sp. PE36 TaxID=1504709 RepID=UPI0011BFAB9C|nr:hypothetical protein [Prauserella sp. PE36]